MNPKFDLLGDPIPENHGKAGANGHIATAENVNKVMLLLAARVDKKQIAVELGITVPTLTKHYFHSGAKAVKDARRRALSDLRARNMLLLDRAASKGNVAAIKELNALLLAEIISDKARDAAEVPEEEATKQSEKVVHRGKKEQQAAAAEDAISQNDLLNPRMH